MRIAGVYWYDPLIDFKIQHAVSEPYGLERILAVAEKEEHEVDLFLPLSENNGKTKVLSEDDLVKKISSFRPDMACFSLYTCQFPAGERIAARIKEINPQIVNVAGNRYPSYLKERMPSAFDFFVVQEGEETFQRLLREIGATQNFSSIPGLAYKRGNRFFFYWP